MLSKLLSTLSRIFSTEQLTTDSSSSSVSSSSLPAPSPASSNNAFLADAVKQLKRHEGLVLHAYQDHLGFWTIGYGRLIDKRKGGTITKAEAEYLLENDIFNRLTDLQKRLPWFKRLDDARKGVLLNMSFQLGMAGLMSFKNTLARIEAGDYDGAAANMLKSKWAQQTPNRAQEMANQMRTGKWQSGTR